MSVLADKTFQDLWVLPHTNAGGRLSLPGWWRVASAMSLTAGLAINRLWIDYLDTVRFHNASVLQKLYDRPPGVPLLTVTNHDSCMDDPFIFAALKWRQIFTPSKFRWGLAASNVAFTNKRHAYMFSLGRAVPVVRGAGVYQRSLDFCIDRLNEGGWVHIFPEGKVNVTKELMRLKWGVGRLVSECRKVPLVVPIWHVGLDNILPNDPPYIPRIRQRATVLFGSPLTELNETIEKLKGMQVQATEMRKTITDRIQQELYTLKNRAEQLHNKEFGTRVVARVGTLPGMDSTTVIDSMKDSDAELNAEADNSPAKQLLNSVVNTKNVRTLTDANADPGAAGSLMSPQSPFSGV